MMLPEDSHVAVTGRTCVTRGIWFTICVHSLFKVVIMAQESIVYCACCIHTDPGPQEDSIDSLGCQIARTFKGHLTCPLQSIVAPSKHLAEPLELELRVRAQQRSLTRSCQKSPGWFESTWHCLSRLPKHDGYNCAALPLASTSSN